MKKLLTALAIVLIANAAHAEATIRCYVKSNVGHAVSMLVMAVTGAPMNWNDETLWAMLPQSNN